MLLVTGSPNLPSSCHVESEFGTADLQTPPGAENGVKIQVLLFPICFWLFYPAMPASYASDFGDEFQ
jgi:hypothetical protein